MLGVHSSRERGFAAQLVEFERRIEDAVDIAEQAAFLATAKRGEFTDASVPRI
jgi:hypothetical protein